MVLGYNHNVTYKGEVFHVQTEDSGIRNPHIITLLYRAGVILASRKTSYADILKIEQLEAVVEDLMKEQHKDMMRRLKNGEFDHKIAATAPPSPPAAPEPQTMPAAGSPSPETAPDTHSSGNHPEQPTPDTHAAKATCTSLDEAVQNFFNAQKP